MFWSYAVHYATVIANMLPTTTAHAGCPRSKQNTQLLLTFMRFGLSDVLRTLMLLKRSATFADKACKGYFVGLKWSLLDRYLIFIPSLDKVLEIAHVNFDEITKLRRNY